MISWPWDAIVEGFDEETGFPLYDRSYTAEEMREVLMTFFSNGVFTEKADAFTTKAATGMSVTVSPGRCFIRGDVGVEVAPRAMAFGAASSKPRYDTVVLRWDNNLEARSIDLYVKQGVAADKPTRPTLTRGETVYELGICDVFIPASSTSISQDRITDTRLDTARCGSVKPFATVDTSTFYYQLQSAVDRAVELAEQAIDGTMYGKLEDQITTTGINLLRGTRDFEYGWGTVNSGYGMTTYDGFQYNSNRIEKTKDSDGFVSVRSKVSPDDNDLFAASYVIGVYGKAYTLSFDISFGDTASLAPDWEIATVRRHPASGSSASSDLAVRLSDVGLLPTLMESGKTYRVSYEFNIDDPKLPVISVHFKNNGAGASYKRLKLEEGAAHNPIWSASPFDVPTYDDIESVSNGLSAVKEDVASVKSTANSKVSRSGDTMTGNLTVLKDDASITLANDVDGTSNSWRMHNYHTVSTLHGGPGPCFSVYNNKTSKNAFTIWPDGFPQFSTSIPVAYGGTGAASAGDARTNLGIQSGTQSVTIKANSKATTHINFDSAFATVPRVVSNFNIPGAAESGWTALMANLGMTTTNVTTTGFDLNIFSNNATSQTSCTITWIAVAS